MITAEYYIILVHTDNQKKNTDTARYTLGGCELFSYMCYVRTDDDGVRYDSCTYTFLKNNARWTLDPQSYHDKER